MRGFFYVLSAIAVMGLAFWAYRETYRTRAALKAVAELQRDIAEKREALAILRAEWAYLNRPERLRALADINFDRLRLLPLGAEHFGRIEDLAYPVAPIAGVSTPVPVAGRLDDTAGEKRP